MDQTIKPGEKALGAANGRASTGIPGFDDILLGGLPLDRVYLVEGAPGTGKTTLSLQFLLEGRRRKERCLYVTLSETTAELQEVAHSHGWSLEGIELYELEATEGRLKPQEEYSVFQPEEVELGQTVGKVYEQVEQLQPSRVVFDSLSEMRLLAREPLRYRREMLALKQFFTGRKCTVLLLDDTSASDPDLQLRSISHGVISLDRLGQEYGVSRRRIQVVKLRGSKFRDGYHDYTIETGGLKVFPRLVAGEHRSEQVRERFVSGLDGLDALLGGGLRRGTSTLIMGPAGSGKSCMAGLYLNAAARRNEHAAYYIFEESRQTFLDRMTSIGIDIRRDIHSGAVTVRQIDPAELSPGEFAYLLRSDVEEKGAHVVVIDSLNGYLNAMPNERFLLAQLHELLAYLAEKGVLSLMVVSQQGMIGAMQAPVDLSYLADTLILLRFFEHAGSVRKAISVIKHRSGAHEQTIRELNIDSEGVHVGEALRNFRGILTGVPEYIGSDDELMKKAEDSE